MKLLTIDSAFETCSVGLSLAGDVQEKFEHAPQGHAQLLLPWVEGLLADAGMALAQLDAPETAFSLEHLCVSASGTCLYAVGRDDQGRPMWMQL